MHLRIESKDPEILVKSMESYFKKKPPDSSLFSQDNFEFPIHRELLYQTKYLRQMIKSVHDLDPCCSKIELLCPSLNRNELKKIVKFLYSGKIYSENETSALQMSKNLSEHFGFPRINTDGSSQFETIPKISIHCSKNGIKLKDHNQGYRDSLDDNKKSNLESPAKQKAKRELFNEPSVESSFDDKIVKEEIEDFDYQTDFLGDEISDSLNIGIKIENSAYLYQDDHLIAEDATEELEEEPENIETTKKPHICSICGKGFKHKTILKKHVKSLHKEACYFCCKICEGEQDLKRHILEIHGKAHGGEKSQICTLCDKSFLWKNNLHMHIMKAHPETCHLCLKEFKTKDLVKNHVAKIHKEVQRDYYKCSICKTSFSSNPTLIEHLKSEHSLVYQCLQQECQKKFTSKFLLEKHVTSICGKSHLCNSCGKEFNDEKYLKKHIRMYCGNEWKENKCSTCDLAFKSRSNMIEHIASTHENVKLYSCSVCQSRFLLEKSMKNHVAFEHEKRISNVCSFCGKNFMNKTVLRNHIAQVHEGKKKMRYNCPKCDFSHTQKRGLNQHIEAVHEGKTYECSYCEEVFQSSRKLEGHVALNHDRSKLFKCSICETEFRQESRLKDHFAYFHEKKTSHLCSLCGHSSISKAELTVHIKNVHEWDGQKNHECPDCDKSFKKKSGLQVHIQTFHEGKKPYKCSLCEKCFSSKALLSRHFNQVHEKKRPYGCHLCDLRFGQKAHLVTHLKGKHKSNVSFFDIPNPNENKD